MSKPIWVQEYAIDAVALATVGEQVRTHATERANDELSHAMQKLGVINYTVRFVREYTDRDGRMLWVRREVYQHALDRVHEKV